MSDVCLWCARWCYRDWQLVHRLELHYRRKHTDDCYEGCPCPQKPNIWLT